MKEVAGQLGPIGAAIQVKLADTTDEETRALMAQQKSLAVDLYNKLQVCHFSSLHTIVISFNYHFSIALIG